MFVSNIIRHRGFTVPIWLNAALTGAADPTSPLLQLLRSGGITAVGLLLSAGNRLAPSARLINSLEHDGCVDLSLDTPNKEKVYHSTLATSWYASPFSFMAGNYNFGAHCRHLLSFYISIPESLFGYSI